MQRLAFLLAAWLSLQTIAQQTEKADPPGPPPKTLNAKSAIHDDELRKMNKPDVVAMLQKRVSDAAFADMPLESFFNWLGERTGALVVVRWKTLEESGFTREMPVTFKAEGKRLWRVLWAMTNTVEGAPGERLAFEASGDSFLFSTHRDLMREMVTISYDVSPLLHPEVDFLPGNVEIPVRAIVKRAASAPPLPSPGDGPSVQPPRPVVSIGHTDPELMQIMELILNTVEPDSWEMNGMGGRATIFPYKRDRLIVRNSLYVHQLIGGFVKDRDAIREAKPAAAKESPKSDNTAE